jgi:hypothetical protein
LINLPIRAKRHKSKMQLCMIPDYAFLLSLCCAKGYAHSLCFTTRRESLRALLRRSDVWRHEWEHPPAWFMVHWVDLSVIRLCGHFHWWRHKWIESPETVSPVISLRSGLMIDAFGPFLIE